MNMVIEQNGWKPYSDELFMELKRGAIKLHDQREKVASLKGYSKQKISEFKEQLRDHMNNSLGELLRWLSQS